MFETVAVPVVDLILDPKNARLGQEQPSQQAIYSALANQQGARIVELARDIVENGVDPITLPAVVATDDRRRRYKVVEGNRRVLALKALDNPAIVTGALTPKEQKALSDLASRYAANAIEVLQCVLFDSEEEAYHWIELRHTGANLGAGLVEWDTNEQDRFKSRHGQGSRRKPAGQILDFIDKIDGPDDGQAKILTTLQRLINTKEVREALGIEVRGGAVVSHYPTDEVMKGLRRVVGDLRSKTIKVKDVYEQADRRRYIKNFASSDLPEPSSRLRDALPLADLDTASSSQNDTGRTKPKRRQKRPSERTSVVPADCGINPSNPRINSIYNELASLDADTYPNAGGVLLRVFLELSVDHEINTLQLMTEKQRRETNLSKRMKELADAMHGSGRINDQLRLAVRKVADSQHTLAASTATFNQYVHNKYVLPKPGEVRTAWDELQPFLEKIWQ
jgi:hypothetical protein